MNSTRLKQIVSLVMAALGALPLVVVFYIFEMDQKYSIASKEVIASILTPAIIGFFVGHFLSNKFIKAATDARIALAEQFRDQISWLLSSQQELSEVMDKKSTEMMNLANENQGLASQSATSAAKATEGSTIIASATEEMDSSIAEIGRQAKEAAQIAARTVTETGEIDKIVSQLAEQSEQIVSIVQFIGSIARSTNLLALNASIEAVRAGEHGRGFAIVANEVKELATQTAQAADQIGGQLREFRDYSLKTKEQTGDIQKVVDQMNGIINTINTALQQQTAATREIANSAHQTAVATKDVTDNIERLLVATEEARKSANDAGENSRLIKSQAEKAGQTSKDFIKQLEGAG